MALIGVYADWEGLDGPARIGYLHSRRTRAREIFEFEYDTKALADPPKDKFGAFSDSCQV